MSQRNQSFEQSLEQFSHASDGEEVTLATSAHIVFLKLKQAHQQQETMADHRFNIVCKIFWLAVGEVFALVLFVGYILWSGQAKELESFVILLSSGVFVHAYKLLGKASEFYFQKPNEPHFLSKRDFQDIS